MAEGRNRQLWRLGATMTVAVANSFRTGKSALKISNFPYCSDLTPKLRQASPAEIRAFVQAWGKCLTKAATHELEKDET